jgi:uncharacterized protein YjbI with pentapeptide repeats
MNLEDTVRLRVKKGSWRLYLRVVLALVLMLLVLSGVTAFIILRPAFLPSFDDAWRDIASGKNLPHSGWFIAIGILLAFLAGVWIATRVLARKSAVSELSGQETSPPASGPGPSATQSSPPADPTNSASEIGSGPPNPDSDTPQPAPLADAVDHDPPARLYIPPPDDVPGGKLIRRFPYLVGATALTCAIAVVFWFAGHVTQPVASFLAAFLVLGTLVLVLSRIWLWLTGIGWSDLQKKLTSILSHWLIERFVPDRLQGQTRQDTDNLIDWASRIYDAQSQFRFLRALVNTSLIIGGTLIAYVTLQKLTEQTTVMERQSELMAATNLATTIDQQFQQENDAANEAYTQIRDILLRATNEVNPSSIEEQKWALGQIPDAMRMIVTRAEAVARDDGTQTMERRVFLPNIAKLKPVLTQFIRMDRVGHTLRQSREKLPVSEVARASQMVPDRGEMALSDDELEALKVLGPVSTAVLHTLHRAGPGNQLHQAAVDEEDPRLHPVFSNQLRDLSQLIRDGNPTRDDEWVNNLISREEPNLPLCLWNLNVPERGFRLADDDSEIMQTNPLDVVTVTRRELDILLGRRDSKLCENADVGCMSLEEMKLVVELTGGVNDRFEIFPIPLLLSFLPSVFFRESQLPQIEFENCRYHFSNYADFLRAHLEGAILRRAHLEGAILRGAHLEYADLREANLEGARFSGGNLGRADLSEANLEGAVLLAGHLEGADLSEANLRGAILISANLGGADLSEAQLEGADLNEAQLEGTDLTEAHLEGADLSEAHLEGADLSEAHLEGADLSEANLEGTDLSEANLEGAILFSAHLDGADLSGVKFSGGDLPRRYRVIEKGPFQCRWRAVYSYEGEALPDVVRVTLPGSFVDANFAPSWKAGFIRELTGEEAHQRLLDWKARAESNINGTYTEGTFTTQLADKLKRYRTLDARALGRIPVMEVLDLASAALSQSIFGEQHFVIEDRQLKLDGSQFLPVAQGSDSAHFVSEAVRRSNVGDFEAVEWTLENVLCSLGGAVDEHILKQLQDSRLTDPWGLVDCLDWQVAGGLKGAIERAWEAKKKTAESAGASGETTTSPPRPETPKKSPSK